MGLVYLFCGLVTFEFADDPNPYQANIDRGRAYLFEKMKRERSIGPFGLGVMALLKTGPLDIKGHPKKTPELQQLVDRFAQEVETRERAFNNQEGTYAIAVAVSCLIADDPVKHERIIRRLVARIIANQKPNGCWSYPNGAPENGDTSQVQYIALALWDANRTGFKVPPRVWDSLLDWQIRTQDAAGAGGPGGFVYQPQKIPEGGKPIDQGSETATMGVAGLSTLLICQSQLPGLKNAAAKGAIPIDQALRPAGEDQGAKPFVPRVTAEMALAAIARAEAWVGRFSVFADPYRDLVKANYYLYGFERVAALRKNVKDSPITKSDWYRAGGDYLARTQKPDGSWSMGSHWMPEADTAFALLFLGRTTAIIVGGEPKVEVMRRSIAVGGEGELPAADGAVGGGAFRRQQDRFRAKWPVAIEGLLMILDDPEKIVPDETFAKVEQLSPETIKEIVQNSAGDPRRLRRWAYDKRPEARRIALTMLARTRDVRFVPILIDALKAEDAVVYAAARDGLRFISRNVEVFSLPEPDKRTSQNLKEGIARANEWFTSLKVEVAAYQEFTPPNS